MGVVRWGGAALAVAAVLVLAGLGPATASLAAPAAGAAPGQADAAGSQSTSGVPGALSSAQFASAGFSSAELTSADFSSAQSASDGSASDGPSSAQLVPGDDVADDSRGPTNISMTRHYALAPNHSGDIEFSLRFAVPDRVRSLQVTVPDRATIVDRRGFAPGDGPTLYREPGASYASLTMRVPVNRTVNGTGTAYTAVDAGDWALFQRPRTQVEWNYTGERVAVDRQRSTDGPGVAGDWLVYLGNVTVHERTAEGQQFRLAVPERADMATPPDRVLDSLSSASAALRVGDRDSTVFAVAAPTGEVQWATRGYQVGDADFWVRASEPVASADNAWLHEYVHTRQSLSLAADVAWLEEGSASYYAALLTFEQERIGYDAFRARLAAGARPAYGDDVLSNRSTWSARADYRKGALAVARLDRAMRRASNRSQTFQTVFRALNGRPGRVDSVTFLAHVGEASRPSVIADAQRIADTPAALSTWNESQHAAAFGELPARVGYRLAPRGSENASIRVRGPYRRANLTSSPLVVVPGERLLLNATVTNAGGTIGDYQVPLRVNGTVVDRVGGRIGPDRRETVTLTHTVTERGTYDVGVDRPRRVRVVEPARATVDVLTVDRTTVEAGGAVQVTARVVNDAAIPGETTLVFTRDGSIAAVETVRLAPGETRNVTTAVSLSNPGTVRISAGGAAGRVVRVSPPRPGTTPADEDPIDVSGGTPDAFTPPQRPSAPAGPDGSGPIAGSGRTSAEGPGLGVLVTVAALVTVAFFLRPRRRS